MDSSNDFYSILFQSPEEKTKAETSECPSFFADLNLNQIIDDITATKQEYNLKPFFYTPLNNVDAIKYRHEIMQDIENPILFESIISFGQEMITMREHLAQSNKLYYKYQKESWFLDAVEIYCNAVNDLTHKLSLIDLKSRGFSAFRKYLINYTNSDSFKSLLSETRKLKIDLSNIRYCILIKENRVKVRKYESEIDYTKSVEETFKKFKQEAKKDYRVEIPSYPDMNHVEAKILDLVALLYPETFSNLDNFYSKNSNYIDEKISAFDREVQFYIAYIEYIEIIKRAGLKFCYPKIADTHKEIYNYDGFDLALAHKLITEKSPVVCNDFYLKGKERIFVVTGPNQGGKTTFARTFGQLHYLSSIGCPVPGREAQLFLYDKLFTHFEKEEDIKNLRGKLEDDLVRIHYILNQATSNSIIIMNEVFTSTTLADAIFLGKKIMEKIIQMDSFCVYVTFIDELASLSEKVVSVTATVVPENPTLRTYKIIRKPADGLAYATLIAEKYRLTYKNLKERLKV